MYFIYYKFEESQSGMDSWKEKVCVRVCVCGNKLEKELDAKTREICKEKENSLDISYQNRKVIAIAMQFKLTAITIIVPRNVRIQSVFIIISGSW